MDTPHRSYNIQEEILFIGKGYDNIVGKDFLAHQIAMLDLGLISIASLGPRASTKVESHVNFIESQKV